MPVGDASTRHARRVAFIVTCEHGGNAIPHAYAKRFAGREALLATHRGYDPGALGIAHDLARALRATLVVATVSRLLVELNRSPGRQFRLSPVMREAPRALRDEVCRLHYTPYRRKVETFIARAVAAGARVVHVSSHSFTPLFDGVVRRGDAAILYDPARPQERALAVRWQRALAALRPDWIVRRNYPYRGTSDGFTTYLRKRYPDDAYAGLELEVSQKRVVNGEVPAADRAAIVEALREALSGARNTRPAGQPQGMRPAPSGASETATAASAGEPRPLNASGARRRTRASATTRASPPARRSGASCRCGSRD
ncbi:MAG TPA: N-formylglutamate amidohydrolase [Casimicrobiaceae bacterium]|nr:N-formylglutamate amidohydrolase [Casimicrobiaceae bacterium]